MPALALGAEPPEIGLMDQSRSRKEHIITTGLLTRSYLFQGGLQSLAAMSAFYYQYWINGYWGQFFNLPSQGLLYQSATSMTLAAIVTTQIGNLFAQRTERRSFFYTDLFSNRLIWVGVVAELTIVLCIIYLPPLQWVFGTAPFPLRNWLFLFAWSPILLMADELRKAIFRRRNP